MDKIAIKRYVEELKSLAKERIGSSSNQALNKKLDAAIDSLDVEICNYADVVSLRKGFKKGTLGLYDPPQKLMILFADIAEIQGDLYKETIVHEFCHHLQYIIEGKTAHDANFRRLNRVFGFSGSAKAAFPEDDGRLIQLLGIKPRIVNSRSKRFKCGSCEKTYRLSTIKHNRVLKVNPNVVYSCTSCPGKLIML